MEANSQPARHNRVEGYGPQPPEPSVLIWMDGHGRGELGITSITVSEIIFGIGALAEGRRKRRLFDAAQRLLDEDIGGRIFALDHLAAVECADIVLHRDKLGNPISMPNAQIAAICRLSSHPLATSGISRIPVFRS